MKLEEFKRLDLDGKLYQLFFSVENHISAVGETKWLVRIILGAFIVLAIKSVLP